MDFLVPPLSVKILRTDHPLIVGQSRTLECEVTGARPKPKITWWKGATQLRESQSRVGIIANMPSKSNHLIMKVT